MNQISKIIVELRILTEYITKNKSHLFLLKIEKKTSSE